MDLQFNQLKHIPKAIIKIKTLKDVNLSNNKISSFHHLSKLPNLRSLWLRNNQISNLNKSVNDMSQLVNLYLENNQLEALPSDLSGLKSLKVLHLSFNAFQELPESLQTIPSVMRLHIDHCKIDTIPNTFNPKTVSFKGLVINGNELSSKEINKWQEIFNGFFLLIF